MKFASESLPEFIYRETTSINDAFQCTKGNWLTAVVCDDDLATVRMPLLLMASFLTHLIKAVGSKNSCNFLC